VLLALLGVALILAAFPVDVPMLNGRNPSTWHGWVHTIAFLLIIATGVLAPLTTAFAVRRYPSWRSIAVVSLAAGALFIVPVPIFVAWALQRDPQEDVSIRCLLVRTAGSPRILPEHG
jgi:hypothetical protein